VYGRNKFNPRPTFFAKGILEKWLSHDAHGSDDENRTCETAFRKLHLAFDVFVTIRCKQFCFFADVALWQRIQMYLQNKTIMHKSLFLTMSPLRCHSHALVFIAKDPTKTIKRSRMKTSIIGRCNHNWATRQFWISAKLYGIYHVEWACGKAYSFVRSFQHRTVWDCTNTTSPPPPRGGGGRGA
jgi:hypothetical protein